MKVICEVNKKEKDERIQYFHTGKPLLEITEAEYNTILEGRKK